MEVTLNTPGLAYWAWPGCLPLWKRDSNPSGTCLFANPQGLLFLQPEPGYNSQETDRLALPGRALPLP